MNIQINISQVINNNYYTLQIACLYIAYYRFNAINTCGYQFICVN